MYHVTIYITYRYSLLVHKQLVYKAINFDIKKTDYLILQRTKTHSL